MVDPPRAAVPDAVARAHRAGIRIHVVTGDYGPTAAEIARQVGIGHTGSRIVTGDELDRLGDAELDALFAGDEEIVFARTSPEAKLRICEALQARRRHRGDDRRRRERRPGAAARRHRRGHGPLRHRRRPGGRDDGAHRRRLRHHRRRVEGGRQVFDNVRKFVLYIFAHAVPEVVPFLVFALTGGAVPLPLTVLQILAIDLGTETLPALALGREPAEPGAMDRPPRPRTDGVVDRGLLVRAWLFLGTDLRRAGDGRVPVHAVARGLDPRRPDRGRAHRCTTPSCRPHPSPSLGIVACQIGTAFAARTDCASLFTVGPAHQPGLLWGIAFELAFAAAVVYLPPLQDIFGTATLSPAQLLVVLPFPFIIWGADELQRLIRRNLHRPTGTADRPSRYRPQAHDPIHPTGAARIPPHITDPLERVDQTRSRSSPQQTEPPCPAAGTVTGVPRRNG